MGLQNNNHASTGQVALYPGKDGLALVAVDSQRAVKAWRWLDNVGLDEVAELKNQVDELGINNWRGSVVLPATDYQLLLIEAPPVPAEEMAEALRWHIRDLVDFDITDAVVDYVELPDDAYHGRAQMVYVAVMPAERSRQLRALLHQAGLIPEAIDIAELVLHNLSPLLQREPGLGRAVLYLQEPASIINVLAEDNLYLTRRLETPMATATYESEADSTAMPLLLDIQRSLDYYESQIGKPPCMELLVCPPPPDHASLLRQLQNNLAVSVQQLDVFSLLHVQDSSKVAQQGPLLMALAAALRGQPHPTALKQQINLCVSAVANTAPGVPWGVKRCAAVVLAVVVLLLTVGVYQSQSVAELAQRSALLESEAVSLEQQLAALQAQQTLPPVASGGTERASLQAAIDAKRHYLETIKTLPTRQVPPFSQLLAGLEQLNAAQLEPVHIESAQLDATSQRLQLRGHLADANQLTEALQQLGTVPGYRQSRFDDLQLQWRDRSQQAAYTFSLAIHLAAPATGSASAAAIAPGSDTTATEVPLQQLERRPQQRRPREVRP